MRKFLALLAAASLSSLSTNAEAGFLGRELSAAYKTPNLGTTYPFASFTPPTFTVTDSPGFETTGEVEGVTTLPVQFTDNTLTIQLFSTLPPDPKWNAADFNGILFQLIGPGSLGILSATVDASTTLVGFDASRVLITDTSIGINWENLTYKSAGDQVVINFTFAPAAVPEPSSLAMAAIGGAALLGCGLRRRSAT